MNILLLGNGFDLYHHLPTKYINFLNTVDSLAHRDVSKIQTIGDVYGEDTLYCKDKEIRESYDLYKNIYDNLAIEKEPLFSLKDLAYNNLWCKYFLKSVVRDITWIDFEKEVFEVTQSFQHLFDLVSTTAVSLGKLNGHEKYIIDEFNFFLKPANGNTLPTGAKSFKEQYIKEYPVGSKHKIVDKSEIIKELARQLTELAEGLQIFLKFFVEKTLEEISQRNDLPWKIAFQNTEHVVTFNYTNTYEKLYGNGTVTHIHGNVEDRIVLGVNPDSADDIETVDTSFLHFKKYYQRIKYKTDREYLDFIGNYKNYSFTKTLYVIGHSLDVTDKDIIEEIFSIADKIYVLSYDETDESRHISNLVNIYGKTMFDKIRREKKLSFISIHDDITSLLQKNNTKTTIENMMSVVI